jgi:hypothetical protein
MGERNSGCELIEAKRANLLYITLYDLHSNKSYKAKCVCGHLFNIDIYISGLFLEQQKKDLSKFVVKENNGCHNISGTIFKTLGIHFDKNETYLNVSWNCAKCTDKINIFITRFFKFAF